MHGHVLFEQRKVNTLVRIRAYLYHRSFSDSKNRKGLFDVTRSEVI